ncbi:hypothetical protein M8J77_001301 [Diaphorina citri]|nr:hypothetical protein M8J77_001301 [Diaphorina citri]
MPYRVADQSRIDQIEKKRVLFYLILFYSIILWKCNLGNIFPSSNSEEEEKEEKGEEEEKGKEEKKEEEEHEVA